MRVELWNTLRSIRLGEDKRAFDRDQDGLVVDQNVHVFMNHMELSIGTIS